MIRYLCVLLTLACLAAPAQATDPDILVVGDSQISFGAGKAYLDLFENLPPRCRGQISRRALRKLGQARTMALGVSSTSLHSWAAREGRDRDRICAPHPQGVNAGVYGLDGKRYRQFVQVGRDPGVTFCTPGRSAFEGMFDQLSPAPKLVVLAFLGNAAERWARNPGLARQDARDTLAQLPPDVPCIFLTTAPVFEEATNDTRMQAQRRIAQAFAGSRCEVVEGLTRRIRKAVEGEPMYFRRDDEGEVVDPLHPGPAATQMFVTLNTPKLCKAVSSVLR